jgi:hypothetical protein
VNLLSVVIRMAVLFAVAFVMTVALITALAVVAQERAVGQPAVEAPAPELIEPTPPVRCARGPPNRRPGESASNSARAGG